MRHARRDQPERDGAVRVAVAGVVVGVAFDPAVAWWYANGRGRGWGQWVDLRGNV